MTSPARPRLAVDLGTTWTAAALTDGTTRTVALGTRGDSMPSVVAVGDQGLVAGEAAEKVLVARPGAGAREVKRRFGDTTPIVLDGSPYGPDALTGALLHHVVQVAAVNPGTTDLVLTHPANWGSYKLDLLRNVGAAVGFDRVELMSEPGAAALHYARTGRLQPGAHVAVYDFGGGTFDAAVVTLGADGPQIVGAPHGLERLGGIDLDEMVFGHVARSLGGALGELDRTDPEVRRAVLQLRADCTTAKELLSADGEATITVVAPGLHTQVRMTRDEFEAAMRPRIAETLSALDRAVAGAGLRTADLAGVVLVGGSSRIPLVAETVASHTGVPVLSDGDAKLVVVLGAAGGTTVAPPEPAAEPAPVAVAAAATPPEPTAPSSPSSPSSPSTVPQREPSMSDQPTTNDPAAGSTGSGPAKGGRGTPPPPAAKKKEGMSKGAKIAAGAAGAAAAAAAVVGGVVYGDELVDLVTGDDADAAGPAAAGTPLADGERSQGIEANVVADDAPTTAADESMDAFDAAAPQAPPAPRPAPTPQHSGGGGGGGVSAAEAAEPVANVPAPDAAFEAARAELLDRLENFEAPPGTSPEDAQELKDELAALIDRFEPRPGQSTEEALEELRDAYDDKVQDFVQDQKIEDLIDAERTGGGDDATVDPGTPPSDAPPVDMDGDTTPGDTTPGDTTPGVEPPIIDIPDGLRPRPNIDLGDIDLGNIGDRLRPPVTLDPQPEPPRVTLPDGLDLGNIADGLRPPTDLPDLDLRLPDTGGIRPVDPGRPVGLDPQPEPPRTQTPGAGQEGGLGDIAGTIGGIAGGIGKLADGDIGGGIGDLVDGAGKIAGDSPAGDILGGIGKLADGDIGGGIGDLVGSAGKIAGGGGDGGDGGNLLGTIADGLLGSSSQASTAAPEIGDFDVLGTSGLPGLDAPVNPVPDGGGLPEVDLSLPDSLPQMVTIDPQPEPPRLDLPDLDVPNLDMPAVELPDFADSPDAMFEAPGFADDIHSDITPQAPDNLDFGS